MGELTTKVGVHICTFNRAQYIAACLGSLYLQTYKNFSVTIVDDCSDQPIENDPLVKQWMLFFRYKKINIKFIRNPVRLGVCKSRNTAVVSDKKNTVFVRLDDDSFCEPDYLERLVRVYEEKKAIGDNVGCVGGIVPYPAYPKLYRNSNRIKIFNETIVDTEGNFVDTQDGQPNPRDDGYLFWDPPGIFPSHHLRSSFLFTRDAWDKSGGYEEALGGSTGFREETAFCFKVLEAGFTLWTDSKAIAWHFSAQGAGRNHQGRDYQEIVKGHEEWFKKHMTPVLKKLKEGGVL